MILVDISRMGVLDERGGPRTEVNQDGGKQVRFYTLTRIEKGRIEGGPERGG